MSTPLTYVYCLVRSARRPSLRQVPAGIPGGGDVRLIDLQPGLSAHESGDSTPQRRASRGPRDWLVVTSVRENMYDEAALERGLQRLDWIGPRALAHEAVIEHFLSTATVLPMQLFTLFKSDERAVAHVASDRRRVARLLSKLEGKVEWGLRIMWEPRDATADSPKGRSGRKPFSGAGYLIRKRDQRDQARAHLTKARAAAERVYRVIARDASAARRRAEVEQAAPGSRLLVDAAFLVPAARERAFRAVVQRHARTARSLEMALSLTGPWPAYNFI